MKSCMQIDYTRVLDVVEDVERSIAFVVGSAYEDLQHGLDTPRSCIFGCATDISPSYDGKDWFNFRIGVRIELHVVYLN